MRKFVWTSRRALAASLVVVAAIGTGACTTGSAMADEPQIQRTELQNLPLGVAEGLEGVMVMSVLPPGGVAPRHTHPADELSYVIEGAITLEIDGADPVTYRAGESYHIPPGVVHAAHNPSNQEPTRIVVFWAAEAGKPLTEAAQ